MECDIENLNISVGVCKTWGVTWMGLLKISENPCGVFMILKVRSIEFLENKENQCCFIFPQTVLALKRSYFPCIELGI